MSTLPYTIMSLLQGRQQLYGNHDPHLLPPELVAVPVAETDVEVSKGATVRRCSHRH